MCANRVEELESRVQELEASVEGLTDELVECKLRLRELEGNEVAEPEAAEESIDTDYAQEIEPEAETAADEEDLADEGEAGDVSEEVTEEQDSGIIVA